MRRLVILAAAAAAVLAPVLALPSPASAASGPVTAIAHRVALGGDPWFPSGELTVEMRNTSAEEQKGYVLLGLPSSVKLEPTKDCAVYEHEGVYSCGNVPIPANGSRTYTLKVTSTTPEPVFAVESEGWVEGRTHSGESGGRTEFSIRWPDKLPLKIAATGGAVEDGVAEVDLRVTNAGTFTMGGYSLMVKTPKGVTVVSHTCSDSGRMNGVGCEIYRAGPVKAGATDRFTVTLKVASTPVTVEFILAPSNRFTNHDFETSLVLKAAGGAGAGAGEPTLPVTGSRTPVLFGIGGGLVLLGAGMLVLLRRRRVVVG